MCSVQVHAVLTVRTAEWSTTASCWEAKLPASLLPLSFLCYFNLLVCLLLLGAQLHTWRAEVNLVSLGLAHLYTGPGVKSRRSSLQGKCLYPLSHLSSLLLLPGKGEPPTNWQYEKELGALVTLASWKLKQEGEVKV